jgi:CheY-like chemotaxis protein
MQRILIVEDNPANMALVRQLLEEDYEIESATNGQEGVDLALRSPPDLILMDLAMPKLDGWGAVVRLRANAQTRNVPVVALTAHALSGDAERALRVGFDAHLTKPLDEDELLSVIRALLRQSAPA